MEKKNTAGALGLPLWVFTVKDEFGGELNFNYDPYPMLFTLGELIIRPELQPLKSEMEAAAKASGIALEEVQRQLDEAFKSSTANYMDSIHDLLKKRLPVALKDFFTVLANEIHIETVHHLANAPGSRSHVRPIESYSAALKKLEHFSALRLKTRARAPRVGRPKKKKGQITRDVLKAEAAIRKRKKKPYQPVLKEIADELNVLLPTLKMALKRDGFSWREYKKVTKIKS